MQRKTSVEKLVVVRDEDIFKVDCFSCGWEAEIRCDPGPIREVTIDDDIRENRGGRADRIFLYDVFETFDA